MVPSFAKANKVNWDTLHRDACSEGGNQLYDEGK